MKYLITIFLITSFALLANHSSNIDKLSYEEVNNSSILSILTLNTWGLPVWYGKSTSAKRYEKLTDELFATHADIVCLQETFNPKIRKYIALLLEKKFNSLTDHTCNRYSNKIIKLDCFGGLMTLSKYPIIKETFYPFPVNNNYTLIEEIGRKGFLVSTLMIDGQYINVINTHLFSGDNTNAEEQRLKQTQFMDSIIVNTPEYNCFPMVLAGDMNFQHPSSTNINTLLKKSNVFTFVNETAQWQEGESDFVDSDFTYDHKYNLFASKKEKRQKLDYIFWKNLTKNIKPIHGKVLFTESNSVSDHNGYMYEFSLKNGQDESPLLTQNNKN